MAKLAAVQPAESLASVYSTTVVDRREPAAGVVITGLDAPQLVAATKPGQFVMAIPARGESAAVALGVYEAERERISLLFFVTGTRTRELAKLRTGDRLDLIGPLGNGFDFSADPKNVAIVAGGVGIASVLLPALALRARGARVRLFYGARTAMLLVERERFAQIGCELILTTDDGSIGEHGFVTGAFEDAAISDPPELVIACGPTPMLRATAHIAGELHLRAQLSLEETFACGVGGCWGCVVPVAQTSEQAPSFPPTQDGVVYARICREGPVFSAEELRW